MTRPRLLAIASGGGHWVELLRLQPAFAGWDIAYVSMFENYAAAVPGARYYTVPDASRLDRTAFADVALHALSIMLRERPRAIVTTGSAPMLPFIAIGRLMGTRSLWIDSIAQAERMSGSGRLAKHLASVTVAQWPDVAAREQVGHWGSVL